MSLGGIWSGIQIHVLTVLSVVLQFRFANRLNCLDWQVLALKVSLSLCFQERPKSISGACT